MRYRTFVLLWASLGNVSALEPRSSLQDHAASLGVVFEHDNGSTGEFFFPEITGSGAAVFDYDNDGDLDIYLVQSGSWTGPRSSDRLFRNLLDTGKFHFEDITDAIGLKQTGYGMGVAAADIDNDGWTDLYITNYGRNALLRNTGKGTFVDVTDSAGIGDANWSTSSSFFDYNRDGLLDLYVANYVHFSIHENPKCYADTTRRDYCGPAAFKAARDSLFVNQGHGRFKDVSASMLTDYTAGPSLGVVAADLNSDGWQDIYVANDGQRNHLWLSEAGQQFVDDALFSGVAVNGSGVAEASMGVAIGDYDNDGDEDIFLTHLMAETNTLYNNDGSGLFTDITARSGLAGASRNYTGWGTLWADLDRDGWLDLAAFNGGVRMLGAQQSGGSLYAFSMPNQVFLNNGRGGFDDASLTSGPGTMQSDSSRGAAFGDLDNDGDLDIVVNNNNGPARVLINTTSQTRQWLGLGIHERNNGRDAYGAKVTVTLDSGMRMTRRVAADGSFASSNDPRIVFYYGASQSITNLTIVWPNGEQTQHSAPPPNRYSQLLRVAAP